jgi:hypothetical protein
VCGFNLSLLFRHAILLVVLIQFAVEARGGQKECALRPDEGEQCARTLSRYHLASLLSRENSLSGCKYTLAL